jgi:hypothetical protein
MRAQCRVCHMAKNQAYRDRVKHGHVPVRRILKTPEELRETRRVVDQRKKERRNIPGEAREAYLKVQRASKRIYRELNKERIRERSRERYLRQRERLLEKYRLAGRPLPKRGRPRLDDQELSTV